MERNPVCNSNSENKVAVVSLLNLLVSEAPLSALHDFVEQLVGRIDDDAEADNWYRVLNVVTRLWEMLSERKHRELEMVALFDTASDLTSSLQDTDLLLDRIVQRARQLFATDTCYLVLTYPETGEARMRVTAGSAGSSIGQAHLPLGWGLVGIMKRSGRPCCSTNYISDSNLLHDADVDAAALDEGIVSIAGAPLKLGEEMLGALFVASRHERIFTESDLDLLGSLANHAAIVLENARLFDVMRSARNELQKANQEIEKHAQAVERASSIHEQLTRLVLTGADLPSLARTVANVMDGQVLVVDAMLRIRASSGAFSAESLREGGIDLEKLMDEFRGAETATQVQAADSDDRVRSVWVAPVRAGVEALGALVLMTARTLGPADVRTLERSAQTSAVLLLMERTMALAEEQVRGDLIEDLFGERTPDWSSVNRRAHHLGLDLQQPLVVLVTSCDSAERRRFLNVASVFAQGRGGVAGEQHGHIVLVVPHSDPANCARTTNAELERGVRASVTTGSAGPITSLPLLRDAYHDAAQCHRVLSAVGRVGQGASFEELGMFGVLLEMSTDDRLRKFVSTVLGPLIAYDDDNGTQLVETLNFYFASRENPRIAAQALHVHTNTVYQRLERIEGLLALADWRSPEVTLELQISPETSEHPEGRWTRCMIRLSTFLHWMSTWLGDALAEIPGQLGREKK